MSDCVNGGRRAYNAPTHTPDEDALTITAHFKDGSERPCTMNRMGRTLDYLESDGERYERVTYCRDCSWFCEGSEVYATNDWCKNFGCETNEDGYCAWSKRRADA